MTKPYAGPITDHFDGTRFFVPGHTADKSQLDALKWVLGEKRADGIAPLSWIIAPHHPSVLA